MKATVICSALIASLFSLTAFADAQNEICKGNSDNGIAWTITVNSDASKITVNGNGKRKVYDVVADNSRSGDVKYAYVATTGGVFNATFFDQDNSVSGYSDELGKFKGSCK